MFKRLSTDSTGETLLGIKNNPVLHLHLSSFEVTTWSCPSCSFIISDEPHHHLRAQIINHIEACHGPVDFFRLENSNGDKDWVFEGAIKGGGKTFGLFETAPYSSFFWPRDLETLGGYVRNISDKDGSLGVREFIRNLQRDQTHGFEPLQDFKPQELKPKVIRSLIEPSKVPSRSLDRERSPSIEFLMSIQRPRQNQKKIRQIPSTIAAVVKSNVARRQKRKNTSTSISRSISSISITPSVSIDVQDQIILDHNIKRRKSQKKKQKDQKIVDIVTVESPIDPVHVENDEFTTISTSTHISDLETLHSFLSSTLSDEKIGKDTVRKAAEKLWEKGFTLKNLTKFANLKIDDQLKRIWKTVGLKFKPAQHELILFALVQNKK